MANGRDYGRCHYCGHRLSRKNFSTDHLIPLSRGGPDKPHNIVDCCTTCNQDKGCLSVEEFRAVLAHRRGKLPQYTYTFYGETTDWT